jgi:hypothetical protein
VQFPRDANLAHVSAVVVRDAYWTLWDHREHARLPVEPLLHDLVAGAFTGSIGYAFSVPSGVDCSDQLAAAGGMYATLPCTVSYSMTATLQ